MFPLWHIHYPVLAWMDGWLERVYVKTWWAGDRSTSDEDVAKPAKSTNTHRTRIRFNNTPVTVLVRFLYTSTRDSKKGTMICQQKSILVLCGIVGVHQSGTYENRKSLQIKTYRRKSLYRRRRWTLVSSVAVIVVLGLLPRTKQKNHTAEPICGIYCSVLEGMNVQWVVNSVVVGYNSKKKMKLWRWQGFIQSFLQLFFYCTENPFASFLWTEVMVNKCSFLVILL